MLVLQIIIHTQAAGRYHSYRIRSSGSVFAALHFTKVGISLFGSRIDGVYKPNDSGTPTEVHKIFSLEIKTLSIPLYAKDPYIAVKKIRKRKNQPVTSVQLTAHSAHMAEASLAPTPGNHRQPPPI